MDGLGLETGFDSKEGHWDVFEKTAGKWKWRLYNDKGDIAKESERAFDTMDEAKENAKQHGMDGDYLTLSTSTTNKENEQ